MIHTVPEVPRGAAGRIKVTTLGQFTARQTRGVGSRARVIHPDRCTEHQDRQTLKHRKVRSILPAGHLPDSFSPAHSNPRTRMGHHRMAPVPRVGPHTQRGDPKTFQADTPEDMPRLLPFPRGQDRY